MREVQAALQSLKQEQRAALQRLEAELAQREEQTQGVAHEVREVQTALQSLKQEQGAALQRLEAELAQREERTQGLARVREVQQLSRVEQEQRAAAATAGGRTRPPRGAREGTRKSTVST